MTRGLVRAIALAALTGLVAFAAPAADARKANRLDLSVTPANESGEVGVLVKAKTRKRITVEERVADAWHRVLRARPNRKGRVRERATLVATSGKVALRARAKGAKPASDRVDLGPPAEPDPDGQPPEGALAPDMPVGFNNNAVSQGVASAEQSAELLAASGADVDRVQIAWERFEKTPGAYDFALSDAIYAADLARGVRPLFILAYAPRWASPADACAGVTSRCLAGPAPDYYDDFARAAAALATRYPQAAGIEVWNEPNHQHFWRPRANPEGYAALLRESYAAIKAADPAMPVAGVSVAQQGTDGGSMAGPEFLQRVYAAGAGGSMDALTVHSYAGGDPTGQRAVQDVAAIRAVRDANGHATQLWVTETGASTTGLGALSEVDQAARLTLLDASLRSAPGVRMLLVHTLVDPPVDPTSREAGFGVVRADLSRKPAFCALALVWATSTAC